MRFWLEREGTGLVVVNEYDRDLGLPGPLGPRNFLKVLVHNLDAFARKRQKVPSPII